MNTTQLRIEAKDRALDHKLRGLLEFCLINGARNSVGVPKTKLFKLVYLLDFSNYYLEGNSISGKIYRNRTYGPVPDALFALVDEMTSSGDISITPGNVAKLHQLTIEPKYIDCLTANERQLAKDICDYWRDKSANDIVEFTHNQRPWALTPSDEEIPYELILPKTCTNILHTLQSENICSGVRKPSPWCGLDPL